MDRAYCSTYKNVSIVSFWCLFKLHVSTQLKTEIPMFTESNANCLYLVSYSVLAWTWWPTGVETCSCDKHLKLCCFDGFSLYIYYITKQQYVYHKQESVTLTENRTTVPRSFNPYSGHYTDWAIPLLSSKSIFHGLWEHQCGLNKSQVAVDV